MHERDHLMQTTNDAAVRHPGDGAHNLAVRGDFSSASAAGRRVCRRFTIAGRLDMAAYLAFIEERALWFGIDGWAAADDEKRVTLVAAGPEAMVGALEMACTLGPLSALVEEIATVVEASSVKAGFEIVQK